jgi:hypothetical protein
MSDKNLEKLFDHTAPEIDPAALHRLRLAAEQIPARKSWWQAWLRPWTALPLAAAVALALLLLVPGPEPVTTPVAAPALVAEAAESDGSFDLSLDPEPDEEDLLDYRLDLDEPDEAADREAWIKAFDTVLASNF